MTPDADLSNKTDLHRHVHIATFYPCAMIAGSAMILVMNDGVPSQA